MVRRTITILLEILHELRGQSEQLGTVITRLNNLDSELQAVRKAQVAWNKVNGVPGYQD